MKTDHDIKQELKRGQVHATDATRQCLRDQLHQQWQQRDRHGHSHSPWLIRLTIAALILLVVSLGLGITVDDACIIRLPNVNRGIKLLL